MKFHHSRETQFPMLLSHVLQYPMRKILIEDYDGNSGQNSLSLVSFEAAALDQFTEDKLGFCDVVPDLSQSLQGLRLSSFVKRNPPSAL